MNAEELEREWDVEWAMDLFRPLAAQIGWDAVLVRVEALVAELVEVPA